ncbi:uncharacterized protein EI97DRAFT_197610 [Westerdykella ornata]|uniref:Uncharacterized protein n=1 Tax=Westerdykella ornata TaxID=318751 RepID=A0A6A6J8F0_WESOR|nr:uncharacterized protein EI97DRAFT_197610 [Westerdykella ornata]KAF2272841.1 hypothetical protein EI97DRAFT_197610 [Westerdykella ornata]
MPVPSTCTFTTPIPTPPTTLPSCALPLGHSNTTLLDTCCNGHINPVTTYAAPGAPDACYQFCTTEDVRGVMACLGAPENLGESGEGTATERWRCFNVVEREVKKEGVYGSGAGRVNERGLGVGGVVVVLLGVLGVVMGV